VQFIFLHPSCLKFQHFLESYGASPLGVEIEPNTNPKTSTFLSQQHHHNIATSRSS
jgi:hypothetical protein